MVKRVRMDVLANAGIADFKGRRDAKEPLVPRDLSETQVHKAILDLVALRGFKVFAESAELQDVKVQKETRGVQDTRDFRECKARCQMWRKYLDHLDSNS